METEEIHKGGWHKKVFVNGSWYFFSSLFTKGLSIILLPIYTKCLSPGDYGLLQTINVIAAFLPVLMSLSLDSAFLRLYHDYKTDKKRVSILISTIYWFILCYGIFILILVLSTSKFLFSSMQIEVFPILYLAFIPTLLNQLASMGQSLLNASLKVARLTLIDLGSAIINGGVSVFLLVVFNSGIIGRLTGIAASALFLFVYYSVYLYRKDYLIFIFSKKIFVEALKYSAPLIPYVLGSWIGSLSDRLVLSYYTGLDSVGFYTVAFQLGSIIYIIGDGITRVLSPLTTSGLIYDTENTVNKIASFSIFLWALMLFINFEIYLFSREIIWIMADKSYQSAFYLIPIISFPFVLGIQSRFAVDIIQFHKKTWIITTGIIMSASVNLLLNLIFIPIYGKTGAAYSMVFSSMISLSWYIIKSQKLTNINYQYKRYLYYLLGFISLILIISISGLINLLSVNNFIIKVLISIILVILFFLINRLSIFKMIKNINTN